MGISELLGVSDGLQKFFAEAFGGKAWLATVLISMIPLIELKGGILFGQSQSFWGENALTPWQAYGCGLAGGLIVIVLLAFLLKPVFEKLKTTRLFRKFILRLEKSFSKKARKISEGTCSAKGGKADYRRDTLKKSLAVFIFVAVPLPLTGVWTGTAIAVFLGLKRRYCIGSALLGNAVAGAIIAAFGAVIDDYVHIAFYVILAMAFAVLAAGIIKMLADIRREKRRAEKTEPTAESEYIEPDNTNTEE